MRKTQIPSKFSMQPEDPASLPFIVGQAHYRDNGRREYLSSCVEQLYALDTEDALARIRQYHMSHEAYVSSRRDQESLVSTFADGTKRNAVVASGELERKLVG